MVIFPGMVRIGNAVRDRRVVTPALASPRQIVRVILEMQEGRGPPGTALAQVL